MSRSRSKPLILVALLAASFAVNLDTTMVNVALPALTRELGATTSQLQWVVDAYNLVFAALLLTAGSLSDRLGRKGMLLAGLVVFGVSSFIGGFATSPGALVGARAVMGLGAAMTFPATLSLLTGVFTTRKERALAIGLWGASAGMAIALGPIVGGALLDHYSWSSVFYALGPVSLGVVALVALYVPRSRIPASSRLDVLGLVMSAALMGLLVYTIIEAPTRGWASTASMSGYAGSVVLLAGFVIVERRADDPMLDVSMFANLRFSAASASLTVAYFTLLGFIFLMTQFFQFVRSYSPLATGVHLLPVAVSVAVGSTLGTRLAVRFGTKSVVTAGLVLQAAFYFWVAGDISPTLSYSIIAVQMVVYGLGMGLTSAPATESIMGAVSADKAGVGSAVNDSTRLLGGSLGVAVIGSVYASLYSSRLAAALPTALPRAVADLAHQSVGAAFGVSDRLAATGHHTQADAVRLAATAAFDHGLAVGCVVAGAAAIVGAMVAAAFLPAQPPEPAEPELPLRRPGHRDDGLKGIEMTYDETAVGDTIERLLGDHPGLDVAAAGALDNLDQFHLGGAPAVDRLIRTLELAPGDVVLDIGSGLGGPARQIASRTGNRVVGIDITRAYVEAARDLTAKAGLGELVRFEPIDVAAFEPAQSFRAAITMHVQMNVRDKTAWFAHIAGHLVPGARLAVWEVCQPDAGRPDAAALSFPLPWSIDGSDSFVVGPDSLLGAIEAAGFETVEWADESSWVEGWMSRTLGGGLPAGPALPMLLDDGYTRVINLASDLGRGTLQVWRGAFTRAAR